jgi:hypothetical protein
VPDSQSYSASLNTPLDRRVIEAGVAAAFHSAAVEVVGVQAADQVFAVAVQSLAVDAAIGLSRGAPLSLRDLWSVWQDLGADGRLDLHLVELDEQTLRFHVNHCAYADAYESLGLTEMGVAFSCRRDKPFAEALVPGVHVEQSETILEGSSRCEFAYTLDVEDR